MLTRQRASIKERLSHMAKGMDGSKGVSPRKGIASGEISMDRGEEFGVKHFSEHRHEGHAKGHPDKAMEHGAMADGERGIGHGIHHSADHHPAQAAPTHGPMHTKSHAGRYRG